MRIRQSAIRISALGAAVASLALLAHQPQAAAQDAGGAVNQASPATERILNELRAGKDGSAGNEGGPDAAPLPDATAETAVPALRTDGALGEPVAAPLTQDGLLRDQQPQQPIDGDLSADGKAVAPADPTVDPVDPDVLATSAASLPPANARVIEGESDARTAAGRTRPVAEDNAGAAPVLATPPDDTVSEDANTLDVPAPPVLRRTVTDADPDPYGAVGYRVGGFLLLPTVTADTLYSDNVLQAHTNRQSGVALVLRPGMSLQSQWSRHALSFDLRGVTTTYANISAASTKELHANLRGRLDVTSRASLEAEAGYDFNTVSRSDPTVSTGAATAPVTHTGSLGLAYNQRFDRLSLRLHGTVADTVQGDSGSGTQEYADDGLDLRASYEFSPKLTVFGTGKTFLRSYANASGADAAGDEVRVGVETDRSAKLSAMASAGGATIQPRDGSGSGASGAVGEASVTWLPSALTTITLAAASNLDITNTSGSAAVRTNQVSLDIKHQFRRWLALMTGISDTGHSYSGAGLSDTQLTEHIGLEYDFNREWALFGDYQRTDFASSDSNRSYAEDQVKFGVRLQR